MNGRAYIVGWASWLLMGLLASQLHAQSTDVAFVRYTTDQGLSNDGITAIARDQRGFIWIGTLNGLNRFDGIEFKIYKRTGKPADLPGNYIVNGGIKPDRNGFLWISTNRGLYRFDPVREQGQTISLPLLNDQQADNDFISPVHFDREGKGWFSSIEHLYRIDPITLELTTFSLPFPVAGTYDEPFADRNGQLWLHVQDALYQFDANTQHYTYLLGRDQQHANAQVDIGGLYETVAGELYAMTSQQGLLRYDRERKRFTPSLSQPQLITALAESNDSDERSSFWLGGTDQLTRYEPTQHRYTHFKRIVDDGSSYPGGMTVQLLADSLSGIIWVGTVRGLAAIDPVGTKFGSQRVHANTNGQLTDNVQVVAQDYKADSLYWGLTGQGTLFRWNRAARLLCPIQTPGAMEGRLAHSFIQDKRGSIWIGLQDGVGVYDPARKHWRMYQDYSSQTLNRSVTNRGPMTTVDRLSIRSLYEDHTGRIWVGAGKQGLFWYDSATDRFRPWPLTPFIPLPAGISRIQEDSQGRLWVLTTKGLIRISADRSRHSRVSIHKANPAVQPSDQLQSTFMISRKDELWLSGIDFLVRADTNGRVQQTYTLANGLLADHIFGIAEDQRGHIWLSTDEQLHELDPKNGHFHYYSKASGLLTNTFFEPITENRQGELLIGTEGGFSYFQPEQLRQNRRPPPVAITEIRVNNVVRRAGPGQTIQLVPGETTLTVSFAALNYSQSQKNTYAYRLVGFDKDWIVTNARTVTYTNLAPGEYQLQLRGANNDGLWNLTGTTVRINVVPAFHQTIWFKFLMVAIGLGLFWSVYRYRQLQQQKLARIRDRIAKDLHDDMGSTLSSIRIFSDVLQTQIADTKPEAVPLLQRISTNAATLAESMQDIIWTIKAQHDGLSDVVSRMREFGLRLTEAKGIRFSMNVTEPFPAMKLNIEQRRNLYLIFKESVNNAIKYADCSELTVSLSIIGRQLSIQIDDNGRGFEPTLIRSGNGLTNLKTRAQDIGGTIQISSSPGVGTTIKLTATIL